MTGKEAIVHYLGMHKSFCAQDVAAVTGATVTSINQAATKMARAGILVIDGKVGERCITGSLPGKNGKGRWART